MARKQDGERAPRRTPRQERALDTIERVFEATARIIEQDGPLTTNHIAASAGISIRTLYSYFGNKDAIVLEMARRELRTTHDSVLKAARTPDGRIAIGRAPFVR